MAWQGVKLVCFYHITINVFSLRFVTNIFVSLLPSRCVKPAVVLFAFSKLGLSEAAKLKSTFLYKD